MLNRDHEPLNALHLNIRSLLSKFFIFKNVILASNFDVICLSETWLSKSVSDSEIEIPGFDLYREDRPDQSYGGVAIYAKSSLRVRRLDGQPKNDVIEQIWVEMVHRKTKTIIGTIYIPDELPVYRLEWIDEVFTELVPMSDYLLCMGDLNINLLRDKAVTRAFLEILQKFGLDQLVTEPTRITDDTVSLIDLVITNYGDRILASGTKELCGIKSDHTPIYCCINIKKPVPKNEKVKTRNFSRICFEHFYDDAEAAAWSEVYSASDINKKLEIFNSIIIALYDRHAPLKYINVSKQRTLPYITFNIKCLMRERDKAKAAYLRNKTDGARKFYNDMRKVVQEAIERERTAYYSTRLQGKNQSDVWKEAKKLGLRSRSTCQIPESIADPEKIRDYYQKSVPDVIVEPDIVSAVRSTKHCPDLEFRMMTPDEIRGMLFSIKSKAVGIDGISTYMLQLLIPYCLLPLTHIINVSLETGVVPGVWKTAIIQPIPKTSKPTDLKDLRPISILPVGSKILEKTVKLQLTDHLHQYSILPANQSGFRTGYSTATTLAAITDDIVRAKDKGSATVLVLLDMSKAFDTVDFKLMLAKLQSYGVNNLTLKWFTSYLKNRTCTVRINTHGSPRYSKEVLVTSGVPQGSILGPTLFGIFTADLPKTVEKGTLYMYADDVQYLYSFPRDKIEVALSTVNEEVGAVVDWCAVCGLTVNPNKTQAIVFGSRTVMASIKEHGHIVVGGSEVPYSSTVNNLGLRMDEELSFNDHIKLKFQSAFIRLKQLYQLKNILPTSAKIIFSDSLILSLFNYCDCVFYPFLTEKCKTMIQRVQNACVRYCLRLPRREHTTQHIRQIGWKKMRDRMELHLSRFAFKVYKTKTPDYLYQRLTFRSDIHNRNTRYRSQLDIPSHSTAVFQCGFSYVAPKLINQCLGTNTLHSQTSKESFRSKL